MYIDHLDMTYDHYINYSSLWWVKIQFALQRAGRKCQECGYKKGLAVHHLTYARLGREDPEDLRVLCKPCHSKADNLMEEKESDRQWDKALDTYATKKYGHEWKRYYDEIEEEFCNWLESKEEEEEDDHSKW